MTELEKNRSKQLCASLESLTAQLNAHSNQAIKAGVIQESYRRPNHQEQWQLAQYQLGLQSHCWTREVVLQSSDQIWALARIAVPYSQISTVPWITRLGERPLGDILFQAYRPTRELVSKHQLRFSQIQTQFSMQARQAARSVGFLLDQRYWFRRSVLVLPGPKPLHCLVAECFFYTSSEK